MTKYKSKKIEIDWIKFDSKIEWKYYLFLKNKKEKWEIKDFKIQPKYLLIDKFEKNWKKYRALYYIADFLITYNDWELEVIDIKGMATETAKVKRKLFEYKYKNLKLSWIVYVKKRWGWIDYDDNNKMKRDEKKYKKSLAN